MQQYLGTGIGPGKLGGEADDGEGGIFLGSRDDCRHCVLLVLSATAN